MGQKNSGWAIELEPLSLCNIQEYLNNFSHAVSTKLGVPSKEAEKVYLMEQLEKCVEGANWFYVVRHADSGKLIGAIEVREIEQFAGQLYCWMHEDYWGTGLFQEAISCAANKYFHEKSKDYFTARVDCKNKRSYLALKKAGFADYGLHAGPRGRQYELILRKRDE